MKKVLKKTAVQTDIKAKTEKSTSVEDARSSNLKKLAKSGKLEEFVEKNQGRWDHQNWLALCDEISREGYAPVDFDQVGVILEQYKAVYFSDLK